MKGEKENPITYKKPERVFVVDLEHSGYMRRFPGRRPDSTTGDIIGIGAAVVRFDYETRTFQVLDTFKSKLYRPRSTPIEKSLPSPSAWIELNERTIMGKNCWKYLWSKEEEALEAITASDTDLNDRSRLECEKEALIQLRAFIGRHETEAAAAGDWLRKVGDCVSFDYGGVDQMTWEHLPDTRGLCFTVNEKKWEGSIRCTSSQADLLLAMVDNHWFRRKKTQAEWDAGTADCTDRIRLLYDVPEFPALHNHQPDQDAIHIACRFLMIQAIADGVFVLDEELVEKAPCGSKRPYYDFPRAEDKKSRT